MRIKYIGSTGLSIAAAVGILLAGSPGVTAAVISGESATASTTQGGFNPLDAVNDNGLDGFGQHLLANQGNTWLSTSADATPWFTVDLGAVYDITSFHVWNYNGNPFGNETDRGLNNVDISYSATNPAGTDNSLGNYQFAQAPWSPNYSGENFVASFTARYVRLDVNSNWGDAFKGLAEIQFSGTPTIPEPSTVILTLAGLGLAAFIRRKRS